MRILAITNLYPRPSRPTLAPFNRQQFAALRRLGHDLSVLAPVAWTDELRERRAGHVPIRAYETREGIAVRHPRYLFPPGILRHRYGEFFLASIRSEARRMIRDHRPEAILACWAHPDGWAAVRIAREAELPVVLKVVGSDVLVAARSPRRRLRIVEALRGAHAVAAVSRDLASHVLALGVEPQRVEIVHEGLDQTLFQPADQNHARARLGLPPEVPIILFVGNLLRSKGADVLIEAIKLFVGVEPFSRCYLLGAGRDEQPLRKLVRALRLEQTVRFVGSVEHSALATWYQACDVVALPSDSEGIPNVLREAAACGRRSVASRVGGIPEIADQCGCRMIPPRSPPALAKALRQVISEGSNLTPPKPFTWADSAARLMNLMHSTSTDTRKFASQTSSHPVLSFLPPTTKT